MAGKNPLLKWPILLLCSMFICSCGIDLGTFSESEDLDTYYNAFGEVEGLYEGGSHSYKIKDSLLNDHTLEKFEWEDEDDKVDSEEYLYVIIPVEQELKIEAIAFFVYTEINITVEMNFFYFQNESEAPEKIRYLNSPETEWDEDEKKEVPIEYDDPPKEDAFKSMTVTLSKNQWISIDAEGYKQKDYQDALLHTYDDGLIYIRMENNSGFNKGKMVPVSYSFINLLVRAV